MKFRGKIKTNWLYTAIVVSDYVPIHQTIDWFNCFLTACGGSIYIHGADSDGYVTSPNYPANYPQHAECIWILEAPPGKSIQLQFEDQFNIDDTPK